MILLSSDCRDLEAGHAAQAKNKSENRLAPHFLFRNGIDVYEFGIGA